MALRIAALTVALVALAPPADAQVTSAGQVRYENREDDPYAVNLRIMLHPAYVYVGTADTVGAYGGVEFETSRTVAVGGSVALPYYHLDGDRGIPNDYLQTEAWVRFNLVDKLVGTNVRLTLEQYTSNYSESYDGSTSWTEHEVYVDAPATLRQFRGLRVGAQYLQLPATRTTDAGECQSTCRWNATRIVAFLGYYGGTQTNRSIWFDGYGDRNSRVRAAWFIEGLVAPTVEYEPFDGQSTADTKTPGDWGWGARAGVESSAGIPAAGGVRFEGGINPVGGWYALLSLGLDLNLSIGGGHESP